MSKKKGLQIPFFGKKKESQPPAKVPQKKQPEIKIDVDNPMSILAGMAATGNLPLEQMEKLMDLRDRMEAQKAEKAYYQALSKFQRECPEIKKTIPAYDKFGNIRYYYANLDSIIMQVKNCLSENHLSYTFKYKPLQKEEKKQRWNDKAKKYEEYTLHFIEIICDIHHIEGHTESTSIEVPTDESPYMSDIQRIGSTHSYGNRYAFCGALGITSGDEDNDGNIPDKTKKQDHLNDTDKNRAIFHYAIIGLLAGKVFTDSDREKFKTIYKAGGFKTIQDYQRNYKQTMEEKQRRENSEKSKNVKPSNEREQKPLDEIFGVQNG
jgi:hypothetical protein